MEVAFAARHYMHLTGVKAFESGSNGPCISSIAFFERCVDGRISPESLLLNDSFQYELKLMVLPDMMKIPWTAKMMGNFNNSGDYLYTEKIAGHVKGCMGFVESEIGNIFVPNTVLAGDVRSKISGGNKQVVAVYQKKIGASLYSETPITCAKQLRGKTLVWTEEIAKKIQTMP